MRGSVPVLALVILSVLAPAAVLPAQPVKGIPPVRIQADAEPFAEEIRQIEAATDKAARCAAFVAALKKAADSKREPEPLVSILRNRKPEETFNELLAWIKETREAHVKCFLPLLITIASDSGDAAKPATAALREYGLDALDTLCAMLSGTDPGERNAAVMVSGKRIGGLRGAAKVIPHLVRLANGGPADVQAGTIASLKKLTLLDMQMPAEWKSWLAQKSEFELCIEIGDREHEVGKRLREKVIELERKAQQAEIETLVRNHASDAAVLVDRLRNAAYVGVQLKAADLLKALLPALTDEAAVAPIDALGEVLGSAQKPDELRAACVAALAEAVAAPQASEAKSARAFAFIDNTLQTNGVSSELRLALLKALNSPIAAQRLAVVLRVEIDEVHSRGGMQLEAAIGQIVHVLAPRDQGPGRDTLLAEVARLLGAIAEKLAIGNLAAPARQRYEGLAVKANDALQYLARLREVDISLCMDALLGLVQIESGAAGSAMTALRQAISVPSARDVLRARLSESPAREVLARLYRRLSADREDALLVNLLGLYETLAAAPEPVEEMRRWLIQQARESAAKLPSSPDLRLNRRDAVRALLARLAAGEDAHLAMIQDLFGCDHGEKDVLGYIQVLPPPRAALVSRALRPKLADRATRVARLLAEITPALGAPERESEEHKAFRKETGGAARKEIAVLMDAAITSGPDEERKETLKALGEGPLREHFVLAAVEKLREKSAPTEGRDAVAELLLSILRKAHPDSYDKVTLGKLEARDFEAGIDNLKLQLRKDGYAV